MAPNLKYRTGTALTKISFWTTGYLECCDEEFEEGFDVSVLI